MNNKIKSFLSKLFNRKKNYENENTNNDSFVKSITEIVSSVFSIKPISNRRTVAKPYIYTIYNGGEEEQLAVLFGYAKFANEPNYGSGKDIVITPAYHVSYFESIFTIAVNPFDATAMRLSCSNEKFFDNVALSISCNINGKMFSYPILPILLNPDWKKECSNMIDMEYPSHISGNNYFKFVVPPKTTFVFTIYPDVIYKLNGKEIYDTPILSGVIKHIINK